MELLISGHNFAVQFSTTFRSNFDEPTTSWTTLRMSNIIHKGHKLKGSSAQQASGQIETIRALTELATFRLSDYKKL